jgi:hypothetical protein
MGADGEGDGTERMKPPAGYVLGDDRDTKDVLAVEAELLRSERIDPSWPGFKNKRKGRRKARRDCTPPHPGREVPVG